MKKKLLTGSTVFFLAGYSLFFPSKLAGIEPPMLQRPQILSNNYSTFTPQLKIIDLGVEPRKQLNFHLVNSTQQRAIMLMEMELIISVNGESFPSSKIPTVEMTIDTKVNKVDTNGDIYIDYVYSSADIINEPNLSPFIISEMQSTVSELVGLRGTTILDKQGNVKQDDYNFPEKINPYTREYIKQFSEMFSQLSVPFPSEKIGIGAKWEIVEPATVNGISFNMITSYELVSRRDNIINLAVSVRQNAEAQDITPPGLPLSTLVHL